jgi:hypothetical protein
MHGHESEQDNTDDYIASTNTPTPPVSTEEQHKPPRISGLTELEPSLRVGLLDEEVQVYIGMHSDTAELRITDPQVVRCVLFPAPRLFVNTRTGHSTIVFSLADRTFPAQFFEVVYLSQ